MTNSLCGVLRLRKASGLSWQQLAAQKEAIQSEIETDKEGEYMWYLVLLGIGIVVLVVVIAASGFGRRPHHSHAEVHADNAQVGRPTPGSPADDWHNLHHDADGTPYGAMDAEFEDWG